MKTELFNIFSEKQLTAIKDAVGYGLWGDTTYQFNNDKEAVDCLGYSTDNIHMGGHFIGKEISGICSGISKVINLNGLNFISYNSDFWGDNTGGMIFISLDRVEATLEELHSWALG